MFNGPLAISNYMENPTWATPLIIHCDLNPESCKNPSLLRHNIKLFSSKNIFGKSFLLLCSLLAHCWWAAVHTWKDGSNKLICIMMSVLNQTFISHSLPISLKVLLLYVLQCIYFLSAVHHQGFCCKQLQPSSTILLIL